MGPFIRAFTAYTTHYLHRSSLLICNALFVLGAFIDFLLDVLHKKLALALYLCICVEDAYVEEDVREGIYIT